MCTAGLFWFVVLYSFILLSFGLIGKHHSLGSFFSLQPLIIGLPPVESNFTSFFLNTTVQFVSQMGPTPMSVLVKDGMMYPIVGKSAANCGIVRVAFADDVETFTFTVPTLIVAALVSSGPCGAVGAMYRCVAPESTTPEFCCGRICSFLLYCVGIYVRVGLHIKLASYIKDSLLGDLCTTVSAVPYCHSSSL